MASVLRAPKRLWKELENKHGPVAAPESRLGPTPPERWTGGSRARRAKAHQNDPEHREIHPGTAPLTRTAFADRQSCSRCSPSPSAPSDLSSWRTGPDDYFRTIEELYALPESMADRVSLSSAALSSQVILLPVSKQHNPLESGPLSLLDDLDRRNLLLRTAQDH